MSRAGRAVGLGVAGLIGLALGTALWGPPDWLVDHVAALRPGCLYRAELRAPLIALTIDDGPDPVTTPLIVAELRRYEARATFFLISSQVPGRERLVHDLVAAGHELGNHLTRDEPSIRLRPAEFERALVDAHRVLAAYGPVTWMRPGSGWYSPAMLDVVRRHRYRCALGSVYPYDAALPSVRFASGYILRNARPGAVIVLHDGNARGLRTERILRRVLPELRDRGYRVVTLSELVQAAMPGAGGSRWWPER